MIGMASRAMRAQSGARKFSQDMCFPAKLFDLAYHTPFGDWSSRSAYIGGPMELPRLPESLDVHQEFPILKKWKFFQHSGVSPMPVRAGNAMRRYIEQSENDAYMTGRWYKQ